MLKLKCNTSIMLNFHVVLKILRNRRLTHTNFYFFKKFLKMQKVKSNTLKKVNYHIFLKMLKLECNTRKILYFHVVLKILCNRRLTHTHFYFLKKFLKILKVKSNTFKKSQLSYFRKNVKIEV